MSCLSPWCLSAPCVSDEPDSGILKFYDLANYDPNSKITLPMDFPYKKRLCSKNIGFYQHRTVSMVITLYLLELNEDYILILLTGKFENGSNY